YPAPPLSTGRPVKNRGKMIRKKKKLLKRMALNFQEAQRAGKSLKMLTAYSLIRRLKCELEELTQISGYHTGAACWYQSMFNASEKYPTVRPKKFVIRQLPFSTLYPKNPGDLLPLPLLIG